MAHLRLGPILRGLGDGGRRVWVETDRPCTVEVLGRSTTTFSVAGHHYGLVELTGLEPGTDTAYDVRLDGEVVWPTADDERPAPRVRLPATGAPVELVVGSCREAGPLPRRRDDGRRQADALATLAAELLDSRRRPVDGLVMLGDQVYADDPGDGAFAELEQRRGGPPPAGRPQIGGFEEYTWLYQHAWSPPEIRWLLATVPSVMIFDDHEIIDDWNTSTAWRRRMAAEPWWHERITAGLAAYWVYQHLGNVGTVAGADAELVEEVRRAAEPGGAVGTWAEDPTAAVLERLVRRDDDVTARRPAHRWSFRCDLGRTRLVMVDTRDGRQLREGRRSILDDDTWAWLDEQVTGDVDHLLIGSSVPWLLQHSVHAAETWSDRVATGRWGRGVVRLAERLRQDVDLEHWAAFGGSFDRLLALVEEASIGRRDVPPATIAVLSGDVHYGYVAEADVPGVSRVRQVVSSPFRQDIAPRLRALLWASMTRPATWASWAVAKATPGSTTGLRWRITDGPWFDDHLVVLCLDGRDASVTFEAARLHHDEPSLEVVHERSL